MTATGGVRLDTRQVSDLLTAVFTVCSLNQSIDGSVLDDLIAESRLSAKKKISKLRPDRRVIVDLDALGHVVYLWQRTPKYMTLEGQAKPIPARGRAPSIEALFRRVKRARYFEQGLKHLVRVGRIRHVGGGKYLPCSEVSIVDGLTPEMVCLLTSTINRLVSTVLSNTSHSGSKSLKFVERVTMVPDLPKGEVKNFKLFAREQGGALIDTVNEWLESRRGQQVARALGKSGHVTAGLHVFSFVEKNGS
jgi:hypothetical protein